MLRTPWLLAIALTAVAFAQSTAKVPATGCIPAQLIPSGNALALLPVTSTVTATSTIYNNDASRIAASTTTTYTQTVVSVASNRFVALQGSLHAINRTASVRTAAVTPFVTTTTHANTTRTLLVADFGDSSVLITAPTTITRSGTVFPFVSNMDLDPAPVPVGPPSPVPTTLDPYARPDSCHRRGREHRKVCDHDLCMQRFTVPMNFTTMFFAEWSVPGQQPMYDYFVHTTLVTTAHWGSTKGNATYWPITYSTAVDARRNGSLVAMNNTKALPCFDKASCHSVCKKEAEHAASSGLLFWILLAALGFPIVLLLLGLGACVCCKRRGRDSRQGPIPRKSSTDLVERVNDPSNGGEMSTAGGTMGKRAEEGRGKVRFGGSGASSAGGGAGQSADQQGAGAGKVAAAERPTGQAADNKVVEVPATAAHVENVAEDGGASQRHA